MKIVCISDTHNNTPNLPDGDLLIHAGDITNTGTVEEVNSFDSWLGTLTFKYKVVIAGNHDRCLDNGNTAITLKNGIYLQNSEIMIEGLRIWGSPVNFINGDWAFNKDLDNQVNMIPEGIDILITHSPPYGIRDYIGDEVSDIGCHIKGHNGIISLYEKVCNITPKLHAFGHIHQRHGITDIGYKPLFINASIYPELITLP